MNAFSPNHLHSNTSRVPVVRFGEIDSTSAYARRQIRAGRIDERPIVFVADRQTAGVGRFGRSWSSPQGGLWLTLAYPAIPFMAAGMMNGLAVRVGLAVLRAVRAISHAQNPDVLVELKWPNDVLVRSLKVAGVLTELVSAGDSQWVLVGVGVNANFDIEFLPGAVKDSATTLRHQLGNPVPMDTLETLVVHELMLDLNRQTLTPQTLAEASACLYGLNQPVKISMPDGSVRVGTLLGLNADGMAQIDSGGEVFVPPIGTVIMT